MPRGISHLDEARHQGRLWTPAHLPTRVHAWYDAQDTSTLAGASGTIATWQDKSGNARHASEASGVNQPSYSTTALNARPALVFGGGAVGLRNTSYGRSSSSQSCVFVVSSVTTGYVAADNPRVVMYSGSQIPLFVSTGTIAAFMAVTNEGTAIAFSENVAFISAAIGDGSNFQLWKDGTSSATTVFADAWAATAFAIGVNEPTYSNGFKGPIGEVVDLGSPPSVLNRQRVEGYLAHRWGLTASLPASHPYKNTPPLIGT